MGLEDAQQRHIEAALTVEQERMKRYRPLAIKAVCRLIELIEDEYESPAAWSDFTLAHWSATVASTTLAVSGQADGYFSEVYPWPDELLEALYS